MRVISQFLHLNFFFFSATAFAGGPVAPVNATEMTQITNGTQAKQYMMQQITQLAEGLVKSQTGIDVSIDNAKETQKTITDETKQQTKDIIKNDDAIAAQKEKDDVDKINYQIQTNSTYNPLAPAKTPNKPGGNGEQQIARNITASQSPVKGDYKFDELQACTPTENGWGSDSSSSTSMLEVKYGCSNGKTSAKLSNSEASKIKPICIAIGNIDTGLLKVEKLNTEKLKEYSTAIEDEYKKATPTEADAKAVQKLIDRTKWLESVEMASFAKIQRAAAACKETLVAKRNQHSHDAMYGKPESDIAKVAKLAAILASAAAAPMGNAMQSKGSYSIPVRP